jgi:hypothetical protein
MMIKKTALLLLISWGLISLRPGSAEALPFQGEVDLVNKSLSLTINPQDKDTCRLDAAYKGNNVYHLWLNLNNYKTALFDISTTLEGQLEVVPLLGTKDFTAQGELRSRYTFINLSPIEDLALQFDYKNSKLTIQSLSAGNMSGKGYIQTRTPFDTDFSLDVSALPIDDIISLFTKGADKTSFNKIYGHVDIGGTAQNLRIKGKLSSFEGYIDRVAYDGLFLNFEGVYPRIQIAQAKITQPDGMTFKISGNLDLTDLDNLDQQIYSFIKDPMVTTERDKSEWTLKRISSDNHSGATELKYLLRKTELRDPASSEEAGILGVQRKIEF